MSAPLRRVCAKIYASEPSLPDEAFVPVFHDWIRRATSGEVLIDVADYTHVPDAPAVILVGHDTAYALDRSDGRFGLLAQRRRAGSGSTIDAIESTVRALLAAADALESDERSGGIRFDRDGLRVESNDRLLAPNTAGAFEGLRPSVEAAIARIRPGAKVSAERVDNDPRDRLAVAVRITA